MGLTVWDPHACLSRLPNLLILISGLDIILASFVCVCVCMYTRMLSHVQIFASPWTVPC